MGVSQRTVAGEALFPRGLNFKANHVHLLARARDPGGCDLFPDPFLTAMTSCSKFLHGFPRLSLLGSFLSVSSFRCMCLRSWGSRSLLEIQGLLGHWKEST